MRIEFVSSKYTFLLRTRSEARLVVTHVAPFSSPLNPAVAFLSPRSLADLFSSLFSLFIHPFLSLSLLSFSSLLGYSRVHSSCFRWTCKFRAAIASLESTASTAGGLRRKERRGGGGWARPKPAPRRFADRDSAAAATPERRMLAV